MASQITSLTVVYSTGYSGSDQRKHQSSASLAFVRGIHRWPVNSPHKGPVTRKTFPFDGVIMESSTSVTSMNKYYLQSTTMILLCVINRPCVLHVHVASPLITSHIWVHATCHRTAQNTTHLLVNLWWVLIDNSILLVIFSSWEPPFSVTISTISAGQCLLYQSLWSRCNNINPRETFWKTKRDYICVYFSSYELGSSNPVHTGSMFDHQILQMVIPSPGGIISLQWRHNARDSVSNHQPHECLLGRLFRCRSKKTSRLCVTGLCEGNSPVTGEFPAQRASNADNVSIWWRHHVL